jgi:hypothetical protein
MIVVVEWLKLLLHILVLPDSDLGTEAGYPDGGFSGDSPVPWYLKFGNN